jgi:hypothetical protein
MAGIAAWLGETALGGLPRWLIGVLILAAFGLLIFAVERAHEHTVDKTISTISTTAHDAGVAQAVSAGQTTTLNQVGAAHAASNEIRAGANSAKYNECLRDSAPGYAASCARYAPQPIGFVPGR